MKQVLTAILLLCVTIPTLADKVTVKNAEEFIKALAPNRTIIIDSKAPLVLTPIINQMIEQGKIKEYDPYGNDFSPKLGYYNHHDGNGLYVIGYKNISIKAKTGTATILSKPRYSDVISFVDCDELKLENIVMGHTDEGYCDRGVLGLRACDGVEIKDCDFFGCGTEGFIFTDCSGVTVENSNVHDCTYHTMHVNDCSHVLFKNCRFHDNREFEQINVSGTNDILFKDCTFERLQGPLFNLESPVEFQACTFINCQFNNRTNVFMDKDCMITEKGSYDFTGKWSDGYFTYDVSMADANTAVFSCPTTGAFRMNLIDPSNNNWRTGPIPGDEHAIMDAKYYEDHEGEYKQFIIFDDGHNVENCYTQIFEGDTPQKEYLRPFFGQYLDRSGNKSSISNNYIALPDFKGHFNVRWYSKTPTPVIDVTPDNSYGKKIRSFYLKLTLEGVDIYEAVFPKDKNKGEAGRLLYRLMYNHSYPGINPRWQELMCDHVNPEATFTFVPKDILAIMRNLPYALQGFTFGKANLKNYFMSQPWYTPADHEIYIGTTEGYNCSLIKHIELFWSDKH